MKKIYVANRGEIACRILRSAKELGILTVVGYSSVDKDALFVEQADESYLLGDAPPSESYLDFQKVLSVLKQSGADAVHPGYGFLSENTDFAEAVEQAGICWVGPDAESIRVMGDKEQARNTMTRHGVPLVPGVNDLNSLDKVLRAADQLGYPVLIKAALGGGGIGMKEATDPESLAQGYEESVSRAKRAFGSGRVYLEKLIAAPHHVEVQVFGSNDGTVHTIFERECSVQRRHQKVIEESPSPFATPADRSRLYEAAKRGAEGIGYRNAGTMEFLLSAEHDPYFLEMNTRLQVEHPVTEMISGLDLVALQLRTADGDNVSDAFADLKSKGHAIEARIYAENPKNFYPAPGTIQELAWPQGEGIRIDTGVRQGDMITQFYDPMIAKLIVWAEDREAATIRMRDALNNTVLEGLKTNLPFLQELLENQTFLSGQYDTDIVYELRPKLRGKA